MTDGPRVGRSERGVTVHALPGWEGWTFRLVPAPARDRTVVVSVEIVAPTGRVIDYETWHAVPIGSLLKLASDPALAAIAAGLAAHANGSASYSHAHLCAVSNVYRFAITQSLAPRDVIREAFGVKSLKTVDRWLRRARERGLLGTWKEEQERS